MEDKSNNKDSIFEKETEVINHSKGIANNSGDKVDLGEYKLLLEN